MISNSLTPMGYHNVGSTGFSSLSLGNTTVSNSIGGSGGFLSNLQGITNTINSTNLSKDPLQTVLGFASKIPVVGDVVGVVAGIADFIGGIFGGVDFEKDVKPKIITRATRNINHAKNYYLSDTSVTPEQALTRCDAYLISAYHWIRERRKHELKSEAWKKGYDMWVAALEQFQKELRQNVSSEFDFNLQTKDVKQYNIVNYKMEAMKYPYGSVLPHAVFTKKQISKNTATKVDAQGNIVPVEPSNGTKNNNVLPLVLIGGGFLFRKQLAKMLGIKI